MSVPGEIIAKKQLKPEASRWFVYIVRCHDDSLYTGITRNLEKRLAEHNGSPKGARYTRGRRPVILVYHEESVSRSTATRRERQIKQLDSTRKNRLISAKDTGEAHDIHPDC
jgi:putative endonuclease